MFGSTGCHKVREAIDSSREPPVQQLGNWYQDQRREMLSTAEFWDLCQQREDYRSEYLRYWNDTKNLTRTKWPVDGVILPVAPSAAVEENHFTYFGKLCLKHSIVIVLDTNNQFHSLLCDCKCARLYYWQLPCHLCGCLFGPEGGGLPTMQLGRPISLAEL